MLPDLAGLIGSLRDGDVSFVAIGGIAVAAHRLVRATEDLDVVPDPSPENIDALANVLIRLDARLLQNPERGIDADVRRALRRGRNLTVTTRSPAHPHSIAQTSNGCSSRPHGRPQAGAGGQATAPACRNRP